MQREAIHSKFKKMHKEGSCENPYKPELGA